MASNYRNKSKAMEKLLAKRNILCNRTKAIFSLATIVLATSLLMGLAMFESCYKTGKIRMAEGQPQAIFQGVTNEQAGQIQKDSSIESVTIIESRGAYDVRVTVVDARKMSQLGFLTAVNNIATRAGIKGTSVIKNEQFMDTLPDGGLINGENIIILLVSIFVIIVSTLVIYNVFYLAIVSQINEFGQLKSIGMTGKQIIRMTKWESRLLCVISIPIGLAIGSCVGCAFYPSGWSWPNAVLYAAFISLIISCAVKMSIRRPAKLAAKVSPINALKYIGNDNYSGMNQSTKLKRNLSPLSISLISIKANWHRFAITVVSLGISGLLFTLAAVYIYSVDEKVIVQKGIYQYGQFLLEPELPDADSLITREGLIETIEDFPGVSTIKQVQEMDAVWAYKNSSVKDHTIVINGKDFEDISDYIMEGASSYQSLVSNRQVLLVDGIGELRIGDSVTVQLDDKSERTYEIGGILSSSIYSDTAIYGGWFVIPEELVDEAAGKYVSIPEIIVSVGEESKEDEVENFLNLVVQQRGDIKLTTMQEAIAEKENSFKQVSYALIGITAFLVLFSIINFISTIIANIATKKQEFAVLQSIGMKKRELEIMEIGEGVIIIGGSAFITFILGNVLGKIMIHFMKNAGAFYLTYTFPTGLFIVYIFALMLITYILTVCILKILQRDSIVEQLKSIE